jgi:hypothetical protein
MSAANQNEKDSDSLAEDSRCRFRLVGHMLGDLKQKTK